MGIRSVGISFCRDFVLTGFRSHGPKSTQQKTTSATWSAIGNGVLYCHNRMLFRVTVIVTQSGDMSCSL